jgi:hypothetical protein
MPARPAPIPPKPAAASVFKPKPPPPEGAKPAAQPPTSGADDVLRDPLVQQVLREFDATLIDIRSANPPPPEAKPAGESVAEADEPTINPEDFPEEPTE